MQDYLLAEKPYDAVALTPIPQDEFETWLQRQSSALKTWVAANGFSAKPGSVCPVPDEQGGLRVVLAGMTAMDDPWACAGLPVLLSDACYYLEVDWNPEALTRHTLGWGLGAYRYTRYKATKNDLARLAVAPVCELAAIRHQIQAIHLVRDLINTPAQDMMPEHLAEAMESLAEEFDASCQQVVGNTLLAQNYPTIHAVGRASHHSPRLLDLRWGAADHPRLTLVGKGVCFDSGGLDLKSANGMRLMKKDMGGAAHVLGLARMVMAANLPVRLRVLIPAVENAVAGNAFRPGDIIVSRKGLSIEVDNTDAEGRLVLSDALAEAVTESPNLLIDFATLTGAARVALGTDVPAMFCNNDEVAAGLLQAANEQGDSLWRLPLHQPYRELLESPVADIVNSAKVPYGGAITAALFLQAFVDETTWVHFDVMAWNIRNRPGRPEGGEAMGLRAVFAYLRRRYGE